MCLADVSPQEASPQIALGLNSEFSIGGGWVPCLSDTSQSFGVLSLVYFQEPILSLFLWL